MGEDRPRSPGAPDDRRTRAAALWEAAADERERLADEREAVADERDLVADERDRIADRHEHVLQQREADLRPGDESAREATAEAELAATARWVRDAESAVGRAQAQLLRAREAAQRAEAGATRHRAAQARASAAATADAVTDATELAWVEDRRDFIAAERDRLARERDRLAVLRDSTAAARDRRADERERSALRRERAAERAGRPAAARWGPAGGAQEQEPGQETGWEPEYRRHLAMLRRREAEQHRAQTSHGWAPDAYGPMLLTSVGDVARRLFASDDLTVSFHHVLAFCCTAIPACDGAAITVLRAGRVVDAGATNLAAAELDAVQFSTGGPAAESISTGDTVHVPHLEEASPWPVLAAAAARAGVLTCLSVPLLLDQAALSSAVGALTLYGAGPAAFGQEDEQLASLLGVYVAVAIGTARRHDEIDRREAALHRALSSRDVIGQAKGILMERRRLSAGDAFDVLRTVSQRMNRRLDDVAQYLADTGVLPASPSDAGDGP